MTVIAPIIVGGFIYLGFAVDSLLGFQFLKSVGLSEPVNRLRSYFLTVNRPDWVLHQIPDALWVFATTSYMLIIWKGKLNKSSSPWIFSALLLTIPAEILQSTEYVPGTYDILDIFSYLTAALLSISLFQLPAIKTITT